MSTTVEPTDAEGNPLWWGPEWDAALEYSMKLQTKDIESKRADVDRLILATTASRELKERSYEGAEMSEWNVLQAWGRAALVAWSKGDVEFFEECARILANVEGVRDGKRRKHAEPIAVTIIETAVRLAFEHERHPTKMEVQEAVEKWMAENNPEIAESMRKGKFRWEWWRWHLSFLPGKAD